MPDMAALLSARRDDGLHSGGEEVAALALTSEGDFAPEHEVAQLALRVVVRWLDALAVDEGPERGAVLKDVIAAAGNGQWQRARALEQQLDHRAMHSRSSFEGAPGDGPISDTMPFVKQRARREQQRGADVAGLSAVPSVLFELPNQVGPTNLPTVHRPERELRAAI